MNRLLVAGALVVALAGCGGERAGDNAAASTNTAAAERPSGTIAQVLGNSRFAAAAKATGLDRTLAGPGPYTVLAPTDAAFAKLPAGRLDALLRPEGKDELTRLLAHHVLPGTMLTADIGRAIDAGGGKTLLASLGGGTLTATRQGDRIIVTDEAGGRALLSGPERVVANGVVHPVDTVLAPPSR